MKPTLQQVYSDLYNHVKHRYMTINGMSEGKASRKANIYAVRNTWKVYNQQKPEPYISAMEFY